MNMFFMKASSMGLGRTFWESNPTNPQIEEALNGRTFRATLGKRTYNGTESNEIKRYYPAPVDAVATPFAATSASVPPPPPAPAPAPASPSPSTPLTAEEPF
jgi:hypothetical protein